jgi:hypothetical protein
MTEPRLHLIQPLALRSRHALEIRYQFFNCSVRQFFCCHCSPVDGNKHTRKHSSLQDEIHCNPLPFLAKVHTHTQKSPVHMWYSTCGGILRPARQVLARKGSFVHLCPPYMGYGYKPPKSLYPWAMHRRGPCPGREDTLNGKDFGGLFKGYGSDSHVRCAVRATSSCFLS